MSATSKWAQWTRFLSVAVSLLMLAACSGSKVGPSAVAGLTPDATVDMHQIQAAFIGSGGGGSGTLFYHGRSYPFTVGGLGIGGIGASSLNATGEVYKLNDISEFPGTYAQGGTDTRSATKAAGIFGCRMTRASSCTSWPSAKG